MGHRSDKNTAIVLGICLGVMLAGCVTGKAIVIQDPAGDDHGPGNYRYPDHPAFVAQSFDLRKVKFFRAGDSWEFEVEFGGAPKTSFVFVTRDERQELFLQTVDIYLRFEGNDGGHTEALPGRNVAFAQGDEWQKAVVISPIPGQLRQALERTTTDLVEDVFLPLRPRLSGRRLKVRVPVAFLGEQEPSALAVLVSAAKFSTSFEVVDLVRGKMSPEGLCLPVEASPGECRLDDPGGMSCHFFGCQPCGSHPQVIDILADPGVQEQTLSNYDPESKTLAVIPLMPIHGP